MSDTRHRLGEDVKTAMRARDKERLGVLRMLLAAVKQREVDQRVELDEAGIIAVVDRMASQHRDSISQYRDAGRTDLVDQEERELAIVSEYLPRALEETELEALIEAAISEAAAQTIRDMGRVMALLKPRVQGRADMSRVSASIKQRLG